MRSPTPSWPKITVGTAPRSIARAPDGRLWVTNKLSASISVINPDTLSVVQTIALPFASQPYGVAFAPTGSLRFRGTRRTRAGAETGRVERRATWKRQCRSKPASSRRERRWRDASRSALHHAALCRARKPPVQTPERRCAIRRRSGPSRRCQHDRARHHDPAAQRQERTSKTRVAVYRIISELPSSPRTVPRPGCRRSRTTSSAACCAIS